jgi:hypothetical protein
MTTQEMIDAFLLEYDLNGSGAVAGFTDDEILDFLNKAQLELVKKGVTTHGPEIFEVLIDNQIGTLVNISTGGYLFPNSYIMKYDPIGAGLEADMYSKPDDYLFYISSRSFYTRTAYPAMPISGWVKNMEVKKENLEKYLASSTNTPIFYNPVVVITSNNITVILDGYSSVVDDQIGDVQDVNGTGVTNFMLSYVRRPLKMRLLPTVYDCELNERWHQDIVDAAVMNALYVTNDVRVRQRIVNSKNENN